MLHVHVCMYVCVYTWVCVGVHTCICVCMSEYVCTCMCVHIMYMYVCIHYIIFIEIYQFMILQLSFNTRLCMYFFLSSFHQHKMSKL